MNRAEFHELLRRIDERYRDRPEALERSTTAWVRLGVAVVAAWLTFLSGLAGAAFALGVVIEPPGGLAFLAIGVGLALYAIAQAGLFLLLEPPTPDGRALGPGEAPGLAGLLDDLRRELGCRRFDEVRISLDFNAGVSEVARLGVFGWPRTVLEVGLPLLLALSPAEFRAVLAHEFVHLSARHGRGGARIHRLHRMWATLFDRLNKPDAGAASKGARWAASRFVGWYWPRLQARSLVLSRHHEYHADRIAAEVAGAETLASALWRLECRGAWLAECFWPDLHRGALVAPEPPADVLDQLRDALLAPPPAAEMARRAERALARRTSRDETHPAFFDRAIALGRPEPEVLALAFPPGQSSPSAADLLGPDRDRIVREQSEGWRDAERAAWRERHRRAVAEARRRPAAPDPTPADDARPPEDLARLWGTAREAFDLRGPEAAEPLLRAVLERSPSHPGASVLLGHHLLGRGDADGERLLWDVAAAGDEQWTPAACRALEVHHRGTGRADLQRDARDRLDRHEAEVEKARAERSVVGPGDAFLPHALADEPLRALVAVLASQKDLTVAWLARKAVRHFPDRPLFVLAVRSVPGRWGFADAERDASLVKALVPKVQLPGQVLVVARSGSLGKLARKVESLAEARVFPAE
ncbi:M48 family metalloprotease [Tundrisphaera sp. TA3]|uniref:M48 family metallopeptidase n=1 Tax=Tundrisphaera sp. TA3 TaxID=3435775 RepID=UPI003EBF58A1